jgi:hypothetical protein
MTSEDSNNYLYIGRKLDGAIGYIGIGGVTRPYGGHNDQADGVLRNGEVWITDMPFSSRRDAEMAESLLIQALTWANDTPPELANIAKVNSSKNLVPALPYRDGLLRYSEVSKALFVKIHPGRLKGRSAPSGDSNNFDLTVRCNRWWPLESAIRRRADVQLLVAVTAHVKPSRVIGAWRTHPVTNWWFEDQSQPEESRLAHEPWNGPLPADGEHRAKKWVVTVESPDPTVNGWQGLEFDWEGYAPQNIGWSKDLRPSAGD